MIRMRFGSHDFCEGLHIGLGISESADPSRFAWDAEREDRKVCNDVGMNPSQNA